MVGEPVSYLNNLSLVVIKRFKQPRYILFNIVNVIMVHLFLQFAWENTPKTRILPVLHNKRPVLQQSRLKSIGRLDGPCAIPSNTLSQIVERYCTSLSDISVVVRLQESEGSFLRRIFMLM